MKNRSVVFDCKKRKEHTMQLKCNNDCKCKLNKYRAKTKELVGNVNKVKTNNGSDQKVNRF